MKKVFVSIFALITVSFLFTSCLKNDVDTTPVITPAQQKDTIQKFITAHGYNMVELKQNGQGTGLMYEIVNNGNNNGYGDTTNARVTNEKPVATIKYKGTLLNNTVFEETSSANFNFRTNSYISAFTYAVTTIGKGGHIRIVTPSYYAYGNQATGKIPANSPLFFDIELLDVTAQ